MTVSNVDLSRHLFSSLVPPEEAVSFVSPGARCLPLLVALDELGIAMHSVVDERSASFAALGHAKATKVTVYLVCTSGTAAANYYPAVIEARQSNHPIIIVSADRPSALIGTGANQTIDQNSLYGVYAEYLNIESDFSDLSALKDQLQSSWSCAKESGKPLHINIRFDEPLLGSRPICASITPLHNPPNFRSNGEAGKSRIHLAEKTLVVVGRLNRPEAEHINDWLHGLETPVVLDISSGVKTDNTSARLPSFEDPVVASWLRHQQPDNLLHIGGLVVSKAYQKYLADFSGKIVQVLSATGPYDPSRNISHKMSMTQLGMIGIDPWCADLPSRSSEFLNETESFCTPTILNKVLGLDTPVLIGNSSVIRGADLCAREEMPRVFTQRGASGIEGMIATGVGIATALNQPTTVVLGDVSALHDLSSISLLSNKGVPLSLVICNNFGGAIFDRTETRKIPKIHDTFIKTPHEWSFSQIAKMFGIRYFEVKSISELSKVLGVNEDGLPRIIECIIEPSEEQAFWNNLSQWRNV